MTLDERVARLEHAEKANAETRRIVSVLEERLLGEKSAHFDVTGERAPGALDRIDDLYHQAQNGGLPAKFSPESRAELDRRTKIQVAVIGGGAVVVSGLIGLIANWPL